METIIERRRRIGPLISRLCNKIRALERERKTKLRVEMNTLYNESRELNLRIKIAEAAISEQFLGELMELRSQLIDLQHEMRTGMKYPFEKKYSKHFTFGK